MMATTARTNALICTSMTPDSGSGPRPLKRRLTEARREQNRLNQRTYRQKQRAQHLQGLQNRYPSSSAQKLELRPRPTSQGPEDTTVAREPAYAPQNTFLTLSVGPEQVQEPETTVTSLDGPCVPQAGFQPVIDLENITELPSVSPFTISPPSSSDSSKLASSPSDLEFSYARSHRNLVSNALSVTNVVINVPGETQISPRTSEYLDLGESGAGPQDWSLAQDMSPMPLTSPADIAIDLHVDDYPRHQNLLDETIINRTLELEKVIVAGLDVLFRDRQPTTTCQAIPSPCRLPNPRMSCIQFSQVKILLACTENARSMGFLVRDDDTILQTIAPSPFYRHVTPADDPNKLLAAVTRPSTPVHLKPTLPQLLYPHPAFMDLIPIPVFRARAITLAATQPQFFDVWELKKDIIVEDGLVFWSSMSSGVSSGGQGQPWDRRSWEAAPWFLRKWRTLVDGEEGEVWKQSLWWQRARGEVEDRGSIGI